MAASFSTDDVYNLLNAVNSVTLKRMEDKNDNTTAKIVSMGNLVNLILYDVAAIKAKLGALTRGSTKGLRGRARKRRR